LVVVPSTFYYRYVDISYIIIERDRAPRSSACVVYLCLFISATNRKGNIYAPVSIENSIFRGVRARARLRYICMQQVCARALSLHSDVLIMHALSCANHTIGVHVRKYVR
jgi:hypothetical protein